MLHSCDCQNRDVECPSKSISFNIIEDEQDLFFGSDAKYAIEQLSILNEDSPVEYSFNSTTGLIFLEANKSLVFQLMVADSSLGSLQITNSDIEEECCDQTGITAVSFNGLEICNDSSCRDNIQLKL